MKRILILLALALVPAILAQTTATTNPIPIQGAHGSVDVTAVKFAWMATWTVNGTTLAASDVKAMLVSSADQFNLESYPAVSGTFPLLVGSYMAKTTPTACYLVPSNQDAASMNKPSFVINGNSVTFTYSWTAAQIAAINANKLAKTPRPIFYRVQLACQRK